MLRNSKFVLLLIRSKHNACPMRRVRNLIERALDEALRSTCVRFRCPAHQLGPLHCRGIDADGHLHHTADDQLSHARRSKGAQ